MLSYRTYPFLLYLFIFIFQVSGQTSAALIEQGTEDSISIERIYRLEKQVVSIRNQAAWEQQNLRMRIDSLYRLLDRREEEMSELESRFELLQTAVEKNRDSVNSNSALIIDARERGKRTGILLPVVFSLLIILTVMFYLLLLRRHGAQTEMKLAALRKYTISELEEAESGLKERLKKSIKKIRKKVLVESEKINTSLIDAQAERAAMKDVRKRLKAMEKQQSPKNSNTKKS